MSEDFESWRTRELADEDIVYLFLDGWYPKVRIGKRRERVPVLVTLGVRSDGEKVVLDMRIAGDESAAAWGEVVGDLVKRKLRAPVLAVIDGSPGMPEALRRHWPKIAIQRCTVHKLRNLEAKAPVSLREELSEDYRRMIYGKTATEVEKARVGFVKKWKLRCPAVERSFQEAGDDPFTFLRFPKSQRKALRTTNALERINEEFRRRTKTQASLPSEKSVLLLLFGLLRSGKITMRKIDGWEELPKRGTPREQTA
jgi:transposase-like protein